MFLPPEKVAKAIALIDSKLARFEPGGSKKVTRSELDKFVGCLQYCAMVVYGGQVFLHRMRRLRYRADGGAAQPPHHRIYLNNEVELDFLWWRGNLVAYNGAARVPIIAIECKICSTVQASAA